MEVVQGGGGGSCRGILSFVPLWRLYTGVGVWDVVYWGETTLEGRALGLCEQGRLRGWPGYRSICILLPLGSLWTRVCF